MDKVPEWRVGCLRRNGGLEANSFQAKSKALCFLQHFQGWVVRIALGGYSGAAVCS